MRYKLLLLPLPLLCFGCTNKTTPDWKNDAEKIEIYAPNYSISFMSGDYCCFEYLEREFSGVDIRYKMYKGDTYTIYYYRNVSYIITPKLSS